MIALYLSLETILNKVKYFQILINLLSSLHELDYVSIQHLFPISFISVSKYVYMLQLRVKNYNSLATSSDPLFSLMFIKSGVKKERLVKTHVRMTFQYDRALHVHTCN